MATIPAITIYQPYASLIINGWKLYELRGHRPPDKFVGQRIAVHAAARVPRLEELAQVINEPLAVCTGATVQKAMETYDWMRKVWSETPSGAKMQSPNIDHIMMPLGAVIGTAILGAPVPAMNVVDQELEFFDEWA